ncbi:hypothetical protein SAMN04488066_11935 [Halorubrum aquaticum]|uniref:Uncharacterized protein n=1 Tax=Halorubrum aquaticum TaxID=387340 RepID=A0A1I3C5V6_9EURY|nr:DUF5810 domain-containing protein [Halorubrum aquaticum]SFH69924.1 hypothetical protein SAMN04488066_11935 [Halorubrum aquaticum]
MGYACPVCATPQRDGEHLAHHLAFTAMLHGDDHEAWLDDHAPDWRTADPAGLAEEVVGHAEPAEYHEVFEDTTDRGRPAVDAGIGGHDGHEGHAHGHGSAHEHGGGHGGGSGGMDPETAAAVEEARELTRRMYEGDDGGDAADDEDDADDGSHAEGGDGDGD